MSGLWERLAAAWRRERRDVAEAMDELVTDGNAAMDRRERELSASPEEKLALEQERVAENDAELEAIRRRIEGGGRP